MNKSVSPIPQIIIDYDVIYFEQSFPSLGVDELLAIHFILPQDLNDLTALKNALMQTNLFEYVNIVNSFKTGGGCSTCQNPILPTDPATDLTFHYEIMNIPWAWEAWQNKDNSEGTSTINVGIVDAFSLDDNGITPLVPHNDIELNMEVVTPFHTDDPCDHGYAISGLIGGLLNGQCVQGVGKNQVLNVYSVGTTCNPAPGNGESGNPDWAMDRVFADGNRVINYSWTRTGFTAQEAEAIVSPQNGDGASLIFCGHTGGHNDYANIPGVIVVGQGAFWPHRYVPYRDQGDPPANPPVADDNLDITTSCLELWRLQSPINGEDTNGNPVFDPWNCSLGGGNGSAGTAMVSGIVSLMYSMNNCLQPPAVEEIIKETATISPANANDFDPPLEAKLIDANKAVRAANGEYDPISEDRTWLYDRYLSCDLYIQEGATLTIDGAQVFIEDDVKINVAKGAKLILKNEARLTNTLDYCIGGKGQWGGVVVYGDPQASPNSTDQGIVIINDATIEHGYRGIIVRNKAFVLCTQANFLNNKKAVEFIGEFNPNISSFKDTDFDVNGDLISNNFDAHASMWAIEGVSFLGSRFKNSQPVMIPYSARGYGIESLDALYEVDEYIPPPNQDQAIAPIKSRFSGFKIGILASNSSTANFYSVNNSEFFENNFCIHSIAVDNLKVENSIFTLGPRLGLPGIANDYEGIKLNGCSGYRIYDNQFLECESSGGTINTFCDNLGINVIDSGVEPNYVNSNYFKGLKRGSRAYHTNRHPTLENIGLKYYCNLFEGDFIDIAVENDQAYNGLEGIGYYQGYKLDQNRYFPAANCFEGADHNIINEISNSNIIYIHTDETCKVPINSTGIGYEDATEDDPCDLYTIDPCPEFGHDCFEGMLSNLLNERDQKMHEYFELLDGGNTESLIVEIQNGNTQEVINGIQNISPYLSESAALTLIDLKDIKYSEAELVNIFLQNPEILRSSRLNKILFEEAYWSSTNLNSLESSLNQNSARSELYDEITFWEEQVKALTRSVIKKLFLEDNRDYNTIDQWLAADASYRNDLKRAQVHFAQNKFDEGLAILNDIKYNDYIYMPNDEELDDVIELKELERTLANNYDNYVFLEESNKNVLRTLAQSSSKAGNLHASNILRFFFDEEYDIQSATNRGSSSEIQDRMIEGNDVDSKALLYPNPATDQVTIDLRSFSYKVSIVIHSLDGRQIKAISSIDSDSFNLDTSTFDKGVYYVSIYQKSDKNVQVKLVIL